jgi:hypothetical protein
VAACGWISHSVEVIEARVSPDGLTIEVSVATCGAELTVEVREDAISVTVYAMARNESGGACTDTWSVELEEPLGNRRLIDGHDFTRLEVTVDGSPGGEG